MKKLYITILIISLVSFFEVKAQQTDINYFMRNTPQSFKFNPANTPLSKFYLNLPSSGINIGLSTTGFTYKDVITRRADDSLFVNLNSLNDKLTDKNFLFVKSNIELFGFGFKAKKNYFSLGLDLTIDLGLNIPKGIVDFLVNGSETSTHKSYLLNDKLLSLQAYISPSISYSREINEKLTIGLRVKMPLGVANIKSERSMLGLDFNDDKVTLTSDFLIRTSSVLGKLNFTGLNSTDDFKFEMKEDVNEMLAELMKNKGLAFDLGGSYKLSESFAVSLSVVDLGFINWKTNTTTIKSNVPNNEYVFEGFGNVDFTDSTYQDSFSSVGDSLLNAIDLKANEDKGYTQMLPTKLYASFTWNFAKTQFLNVLYKGTFSDAYTTNDISLFYSMQLGRYLNISLGNTFAFESYSSKMNPLNPSVALNLNLYCLNIYLGGALRSSVNAIDVTGLNVFAGVNFAFGYNEYWERKNIVPEEEPQIIHKRNINDTIENVEDTVGNDSEETQNYEIIESGANGEIITKEADKEKEALLENQEENTSTEQENTSTKEENTTTEQENTTEKQVELDTTPVKDIEETNKGGYILVE
ncbi:MAG: DUF5723 family protein [Bacteroidales bacterium]|jgi:hypothetical protein|nr:DUF5723 family protein [Bacteroidales bacterium]